MTGEIDVQGVLDERKRLKAWQSRMRGQVEWVALKEYWRAEYEERGEVIELYGELLIEALKKWQMVKVERAERLKQYHRARLLAGIGEDDLVLI